MRMRRKPYARPELAACNFYIDRPCEALGKVKDNFKTKNQPLYIELGCGKGGFIAELASQNPDKNFFGFDIKSEVLVVAKRNIEAVYKAKNLDIDNVIITSHDIERIDEVLNNADEVSRIYINFCNPWPKTKHHKRRLTHPRQLEKYKTFLAKDGEIFFKTDDDDLFNASVEYFNEAGFETTFLTRDLHAENLEDNIVTEHENMFSAQGIKIKALRAKVK
ncbi:MAG: tRNA (guanosine(46)-N7)-methyltransferase TrmB [Oscillospiraceae bacterium]